MNKEKALKVKQLWYSEEKLIDYQTGLFLELENGVILAQCSTDAVQPYAAITPNPQ